MSGPCTDCGGPDYQTLVDRIVELGAERQTSILYGQAQNRAHKNALDRVKQAEEELATVNALLDMKREREQHWNDEAWRYKNLYEQLQAERSTT